MLAPYVLALAAAVGPCAVAPAASPPHVEVTCAAIGCPSDRSLACEAQPAADAIRADGYSLTCSPTVEPPSPLVQGMTDHGRRLVSVWPGSSEGQTIAVLYHEGCHVHLQVTGREVVDEERHCWAVSYCRDPQNGVGYPVKPSPAECQATYL